MTPNEFRRHGQLLIDWIADYLADAGTYPVCSPVAPHSVRERLAAHPPAHPDDFAEIWDDFLKIILPGITHWQSPNFFGYFPCNNSLPSILGELLSAGLGVQGMLWSTSPSCTELETHVLDWVVELLGLPESFRSDGEGGGGGVIQDSASSATLCAMLAGRWRATQGEDKRQGTPRDLVAYCSDQAHSSVDKAAIISGLGLDRLRKVPSDAGFRMDARALEQLIDTDRRAGRVPFFVTATQGTTSSGAIDPLSDIATICQAAGAWLHVDGAMMGAAACCEQYRWIHDGLELADSYCFNPHKWMLVNFDCDCFYVRDRRPLIGAMNVDPEYLRNPHSETGQVIDYRDWQVPLGRRFRALKLWFVLRGFGSQALAELVRNHVQWAREFASWVDEDPHLQLVRPVNLNLVCFRHAAGERSSQQLLQALNDSGKLFLTHTRLDEQYTLRFCIGQARTSRQHVIDAWDRIRQAASRVG